MSGGDVGSSTRDDGEAFVVHEEELAVGKTTGAVGRLGLRKHVDSRIAEQLVDRDVEHLDEVERVPATDGDSGQIETLPDGSVSIPLLEEELVVTKRTVVRERVIVRKRTETERQRVEAELRRERVELEADEGVEIEREMSDGREDA